MTSIKNERPAPSQNEQSLLSYHGSNVAFERIEGKLMVNATQMAQSFNKQPIDWLKTQPAKDLINAVAKLNKISLADLQTVKKGGNNPGTWFQEDVALAFAQWLSPEFYVMCNNKLKELLLNETRHTASLPETASGWQEETPITVPMGSAVNQIWVSGGVIFARLNPLLRYIGLNANITRERIARIGREHFRLVQVEKQPAYFANFAGFNGLIESTTKKMSARTLCEVYRMFGVPDAEHESGSAYTFSGDEMHALLKAANRRPYDRAAMIDLLLNGKTEGGGNGTV